MNELDEETREEIFSIIAKAIENENIYESVNKYKTDITVLNSEQSSFGAFEFILGVNVAANLFNGREIYMDLFVKISDKSKSNRKIFRRQKHTYTEIFWNIHQFLMHKHMSSQFDFIDIWPIPFKMFSTDTREVLIYNKLSEIGYTFPLNKFSAPKLMNYGVLAMLAKFHAVSFAFREQKPEEFSALVKEWNKETTPEEILSKHPNVCAILKTGLKMTIDMLKEEQKTDLVDKIKNDFKNGALAVITKVLSERPDDCVVVHGDLWLNNIMVKNKVYDSTTEMNLKFINWELSTIHSPALDLAYYIYFTISEEPHEIFEHYVEYYYKEFHAYLIKYESDPDKSFPFLKLLDHLSKYSIYALIMTLSAVPFITVNSLYVKNESVIEGKNDENCGKYQKYERLKYSNLRKEVKDFVSKKIISVLELHYKYFSG
ncbi:unnamed protein product [Phyllotreta striolata]|uniref:CHK kinase-like domain-containing protein n=1 Tax=Phyllotreta striolata TaxID=444603 RepID=A0A9N9TNN2_PHYSR|nr:unnamed protein product [Phyllotreta striolata]